METRFRLHADPRQALRMQRSLMGMIAYLMWMAVGIYLHLTGLLRVDLVWLLGYFSLHWLTIGTFLTMIRWNWNLRFQDPGMTMLQIGVGIFWGMVLLYQAAPEARGGMLLVFVTGLFFGIFRLTTRQFLLLTLFTSLAYAALIRFEWAQMDEATRQTEVAQWLFLTVMLVWMSFMGGYVAGLRANLRRAMRQIEELASRDHLTGTRNRRAITGSLEEALRQATEEGQALTIGMLDLDDFKGVNDRHGHPAGDTVLRDFVTRAEKQLRVEDLLRKQQGEPLGRFGGEEFLVVLPGTGLAGGRLAVERIRQAIAEQPFSTEAGDIKVTVSIGLSSYQPGDDAEALLRRADRALYRAKDKGRNRVETE